MPLFGETSSGLALVEADGVTETAKRTCGAIWVPVTVTVA